MGLFVVLIAPLAVVQSPRGQQPQLLGCESSVPLENLLHGAFTQGLIDDS